MRPLAGLRLESGPRHAPAEAEHEAFCGLLEDAGAEVVLSRHDPGNPDAIYPYDPVLVGEEGAVLLRPGKEGRRREPATLASTLEDAGVPVVAEIAEPAFVEGGDTLWLDEKTLLVGIGYRTNAAAITALQAAFPDVELLTFDLPHWNGTGEVLHLMSLISPLDDDLAVVYPRLAPVRLLRLLADRGIGVVEVPDEEFESQGSNVLALGPRRALALDGNPETRRRMERVGVDVTVYRGEEISRKGDGGPTCLTRLRSYESEKPSANPSAVSRPASRPPSSNASGIIVSESITRSAPAANPSANAPSAAGMVSSAHHPRAAAMTDAATTALHIASRRPLAHPPSRSPIVAESASGTFDTNTPMTTATGTIPSTWRDAPRTNDSGIPSSTDPSTIALAPVDRVVVSRFMDLRPWPPRRSISQSPT